jgi:hypothetical protein
VTEQQQPHSRTPKEAARYINVSEAALRLWRRHGAGPRYFLAGPRLIRYRQIDLDAWIEARLASKRGAAEVAANVPSAALSPQESTSGACAHLGGARSAAWCVAICVVFLLCSLGVHAQSTAAIQRHCYLGGTKAITQGLSSTNYNLGIIPACTVKVYLTGTQTLATIYADASSTPLANPFTANTTNSVDPGGWIFWAAVNTGYDVVMSGGGGNPNCTTAPNCYTQPATLTDLYPSFSFSGGGANLPHVLELLSGDGLGGALGTPELGTLLIAGSPNTARIAWATDNGMAKFDCRGPGYDGGCLGPTPGLAMQDLANDLICYNAMTGLSANVTFPPGNISIGTPTQPTLKLPTGNRYQGASSGFTGIATNFDATYNNVSALEFDDGLTATCKDGNVHTAATQQGYYSGINVHGCGQGGCVNVPGDSTGYGNGGPLQTGVIVNDFNAWVNGLAADHNGADGVTVAGVAPIVGPAFATGNNAYFIFGKGAPAYNPATDGVHYNINLAGQDGWFYGPFVTYGYLDAPGVEFGHVVEVGWGGFTSNAGNIFVNRGQIGIQREPGSEGGHLHDFRIDGTSGPGLVAASGADWFKDGTITSSCGAPNVAWSSVGSVAVATPGSGQTPGTYTLTGSGGLSTGVGGLNGDGSGSAGTNAVIQVVVGSGGTVTTTPTVLNAGAKYTYLGSAPTFTLAAGGTPATFTVTMTPPLQTQTIGGITVAFCDYIQDGGTGGDHYDSILNQGSNFFGPDWSTGGIMPDASAYWRKTTGFMETPAGANTGAGQNIEPYLTSIQATTGTNPRVDLGGLIQPSDSSATNIVGVNHAWIGEVVTVIGGNANDTLVSSLNGGAWITNSGYNINLAPHSAWTFIVTAGTAFGTPPILQELGPSIDMNHWWVNHAGNAGSLPPLVQQGTVDSMGDIRSHAIPALPGLHVQAGGTPDGVHGFGGTWTYAYRVWGPWGTQTSAVTPNVTQCMPAAGFVNNPCFQTPSMTLPEGFTRYVLTRESTTDSVATAGTIADVTFTTPQHAASVAFADTYIPPINGTTIGSANYSANMTGGPWECGTLPPVSAYPAVAGQRCESPATGVCYWADATDHWKQNTTSCIYANF